MASLYPKITFTVNFAINRSELFGPDTNQTDRDLLHPDRHDNDQDRAITNIANHSTEKISWLSGLLNAENITLTDGKTFILEGQKAEYVRKLYVAAAADGVKTSSTGEATPDRAILTVTTVE